MNDREWTSERVRAFRTKLGKTQREFAELIPVHLVTLIRWENDKFKPSRMALKRLDDLYKKNS